MAYPNQPPQRGRPPPNPAQIQKVCATLSTRIFIYVTVLEFLSRYISDTESHIKKLLQMLDENSQLIKTITEYQSQGKPQEAFQ